MPSGRSDSEGNSMRKTTLVAAGAALVLTLSACSGNSTTGTAQPAAAGGQSQDGGSRGLASPFTDAIQLASASKKGTERSKSAKFTMEGTAAGQTISMNGAVSTGSDGTKLSMTSTAAGQTTEMRLVDKVMYIKLPAGERKQLGTDKAWAKISPDGTDPLSQALGGALSQTADQSDPSKMLDQISKAGRIISSDQTQLNGEQVNHYKVETTAPKPFAQFAAKVPAGARAKLNERVKARTSRSRPSCG